MSRYDPFEEMDRMFEQLRTRTWSPERSSGPRSRFGTGGGVSTLFGEREGGTVNMDLTKHDTEYVFVADLPGFEREEIDLTFADDVLTVTAESETADAIADETTGDTDEIAVRSEFARSRRVAERVTIPEAVAEDEISASYRNGVLEVHLPLVESEGKEDDGKRIDIAD